MVWAQQLRFGPDLAIPKHRGLGWPSVLADPIGPLAAPRSARPLTPGPSPTGDTGAVCGAFRQTSR